MRINDFFDKVVVINLDRRTDRMEKLDTQLQELGIQYERFSAIDGKNLEIDPIVAGNQSHLKVLQKYLQQRVLILEDDALFVNDFQAKFDEAIQHLPADWDILYLGALVDPKTGKLIKTNDHWSKQIVSTGAQAYCVNPNKMAVVIEKLIGYEWYIDIGLRELNENLNCYIAHPNLVIQFPSFSDLRLQEVNDF